MFGSMHFFMIRKLGEAMKKLFSLAIVLATTLSFSACVMVPPGHAKGCGVGPGNSGTAPGQVKKNCR